LTLERVIACIDPGNAASVAVATRLGLVPAEVVDDPHGAGELLIFQAA
jgi:RimJ/RimL family protein N-acetyltransferase